MPTGNNKKRGKKIGHNKAVCDSVLTKYCHLKWGPPERN